MKKINYICLASGILLLVLWVIDILSFFKISEVWLIIKELYGLAGWVVATWLVFEGFPTTDTKDNKTRKICNICGNDITKDENSVHYHTKPGDSNTIDYCEKCKNKIIK